MSSLPPFEDKSKTKKGFRSLLRTGIDRVFQSRSPSPSRQLVGPSTTRLNPPSPTPDSAANCTIVADLASPSIGTLAAASHQSVILPALGVNPSIYLSPTVEHSIPVEPVDAGDSESRPSETAPEAPVLAQADPSMAIAPATVPAGAKPGDTTTELTIDPISPTTNPTKPTGSVAGSGLRKALGALHQSSKLFCSTLFGRWRFARLSRGSRGKLSGNARHYWRLRAILD
jgi:hypothetical protein